MPSISEQLEYINLIKQWRHNTVHCSLMEDKLLSEQVKYLLELPKIERLLIKDVMSWSVFQNRPLYDVLVLLRIVLNQGPDLNLLKVYENNIYETHMIWVSWLTNYGSKKYLNLSSAEI